MTKNRIPTLEQSWTSSKTSWVSLDLLSAIELLSFTYGPHFPRIIWDLCEPGWNRKHVSEPNWHRRGVHHYGMQLLKLLTLKTLGL